MTAPITQANGRLPLQINLLTLVIRNDYKYYSPNNTSSAVILRLTFAAVCRVQLRGKIERLALEVQLIDRTLPT